jgi:hypothetical protein
MISMRAPSANSATPLSPQPTRVAAAERAEVLRAIFVETAALSTRKAAEVLNARGVANPYRQAVAAHDGGARPRATESTPERYKRGSIASVAPQERRDHP